jgi:hypothetical protein
MPRIHDADQHIFETAQMWRDYADPAKRELALVIEPDELGYSWIVSPATGKRIYYAYIPTPQDDFEAFWGPLGRRRRGLPSERDYTRDLPLHYYDAAARVQKLDEFGIDRALQVPNYALVWGRGVEDRVDILRANMEAWNRRAAELQADAGDRFVVAGNLTLRGDDLDWFDEQIAFLSRSGVQTALVNYGLVDGKRLSHPDHERAWSAFVEHGVVPLFHIVDNDQHPSGLPGEWFEGDDGDIAAVELPFAYVGIQVALADLVLRGVFERHPDLVLGVVELQANWLPLLTRRLDYAYDQQYKTIAYNVCKLTLRPSEYLPRHVRLSAHWAADDIRALRAQFGDIFMFGGDYPHCEGLVSPYADYRKAVGDLPLDVEDALYGNTMASLFA